MNILAQKLSLFTSIFLFLAFSESVNSQSYPINGLVNSSTLSCSSFVGYTVITIGDGNSAASLKMNNNLNLTTCSLGPVQIIVNNNATIDFSVNNSDLKLPAGSSISFVGNGTIYSGTNSQCSASDRISIGGVLLATCEGQPGVMSFDSLVTQGGYNFVSVSPSSASACGSGTFSFTVKAIPSTGATIKWYTTPSLGTSIYTGTTFSPTLSSTTTYYVDASYGSGTSAYTTPRVAVVATVNDLPIITTQAVNQLDCEGSVVGFKAVATGTGLTYAWQRKKPGDSGFITIPIETNVSYPTAGEIRLQNVGSAQAPNGTLYQVLISNAAFCSVTSNPATLSVNEIIGVTSGTSVTQCYGTDYSYTVTTSYPSNVVSYRWKRSVVSGIWTDVVNGAHFSGATTATLNVIGGTPSESAEYRVYITFKASGADCNVSSDTRTRNLTFLPQLQAPVIGNITQPDCTVATGSVVLSGLPLGGKIIPGNISYPGTNYTITGLNPATTYNFSVVNAGGCTSLATSNVVIGAAAITCAWTANSWSPRAPSSVDTIVFNSDYSSASDLKGCSCLVTAGNVVINSGHTLAITNRVTVSGGTITFENNASLVQINDNAINSGLITYKRKTTPILNSDYTYWSSPVANQSLYNTSPNTSYSKFYSYNAGLNNWEQENPAISMVTGKGYIIHGPVNNVTPTIFEASFVGVPNNGILTTPIASTNSFNLIGNPYPSAISADKFLTENSNVLNGTIYLWTHNTPITNNVYSSNDYAVYNLLGGIYAKALNPGVNNSVPSGNIAAGQAFFTVSLKDGGGMATFNNAMRVDALGSTLDNSQFFKFNSTKPKTVNTIEKNRIWLNMINGQGIFKQILVGYITGATNGYDGHFDGECFIGNEFLDFYSIDQSKNLVIQGRALPFDENDTVPLGFRSAIDGSFTINIDEADGLLSNQAIFIEDKLTNTVFDLKSGDYTFTTIAGTFNGRFVLRYTNKNLGNNNFSTKENLVLVSNTNKQIRINAFAETIDKVSVYDIAGKQIFQKTNVNSNELSISNLRSGHQVLVLKTSLQNGTTVSNKIIY